MNNQYQIMIKLVSCFVELMLLIAMLCILVTINAG